MASNAFGMWLIKTRLVALAEMEQSGDLGVLNILCLHMVNYALAKLVKYGLVQSEKQGKEVFYGTTQQG